MKFAKNLAQICNIQSKTFLVSRISTCLTWSALAGSNAVAETSQCATTAAFFHIIPWRTKWENWGTRTPGKYGGGLSLLGGGAKAWNLSRVMTVMTKDCREIKAIPGTFTDLNDVWSEGRHLHHGDVQRKRDVCDGGNWLLRCGTFLVEKTYKSSVCRYCDVVHRLALPVQKRRKQPHAKTNPKNESVGMCKSSLKCENVKGNCHCQKRVDFLLPNASCNSLSKRFERR